MNQNTKARHGKPRRTRVAGGNFNPNTREADTVPSEAAPFIQNSATIRARYEIMAATTA